MNGVLFSWKMVSGYSWWISHHCLCSILWFGNLIYLSPGFTESFMGYQMKPLWVFSYSPRDKNFRGFQYEKNHQLFKLGETFSGFLIQSTRQDLCGFSLRVNHLWFRLKKETLLCTTVLHHRGIVSFDKSLKES